MIRLRRFLLLLCAALLLVSCSTGPTEPDGTENSRPYYHSTY